MERLGQVMRHRGVHSALLTAVIVGMLVFTTAAGSTVNITLSQLDTVQKGETETLTAQFDFTHDARVAPFDTFTVSIEDRSATFWSNGTKMSGDDRITAERYRELFSSRQDNTGYDKSSGGYGSGRTTYHGTVWYDISFDSTGLSTGLHRLTVTTDTGDSSGRTFTVLAVDAGREEDSSAPKTPQAGGSDETPTGAIPAEQDNAQNEEDTQDTQDTKDDSTSPDQDQTKDQSADVGEQVSGKDQQSDSSNRGGNTGVNTPIGNIPVSESGLAGALIVVIGLLGVLQYTGVYDVTELARR